MAKKLNYDAKSILDIKFSPNRKGYDPLEVDKVFDKIIEDYQSTLAEINLLTSQNAKQQQRVDELRREVESLTLELTSLKKKYDILKSTNSVNEDNYALLQKIAAYERALYKKGVNPKKALSDPDNC